MKKVRVAINGFGRIGRPALKIALKKKNLEVVAINDLTDIKTLAHLLKYDSSYGTYEEEVKVSTKNLVVAGNRIKILAEKDPARLPWKRLKVDLVLECSGLFTTKEKAGLHFKAGAKRVIISAPSESKEVPTFVLGVNDKKYNSAKDNLISMASCTTNCLAPLVEILHRHLKVKKGFMTTAHSYTNDQRLLDLPHKDLRRARAAGLSIIPTTTGAAKAIGRVMPELDGLLDGISLRVPTPTVSILDFICQVGKKTTAEAVNRIFSREAKNPRYQGILGVSAEPLVSADYKKDPRSAIVDLALTMAAGDLVKVVAWYDNEWGYSCRLVELAELVGKKL